MISQGKSYDIYLFLKRLMARERAVYRNRAQLRRFNHTRVLRQAQVIIAAKRQAHLAIDAVGGAAQGLLVGGQQGRRVRRLDHPTQTSPVLLLPIGQGLLVSVYQGHPRIIPVTA